MGMALGDALSAHVEFRPHEYLLSNPVIDLVGGGTWGLQPGQVLHFHQIFNLRSFFLFVRRYPFFTHIVDVVSFSFSVENAESHDFFALKCVDIVLSGNKI